MDIVKSIMLYEKTYAYTISAKTCCSSQGSADIGFGGGYIEKDNLTYYFANCARCCNPENLDFSASRKKLSMTFCNHFI